jgi:hypothetical protein
MGVGMRQISKQRIQIRTFNLRLRSHQNSKTAKPPEQRGYPQPKWSFAADEHHPS